MQLNGKISALKPFLFWNGQARPMTGTEKGLARFYLEKILEAECFSTAPIRMGLLRHIVEATLRGDRDALTREAIATAIWGGKFHRGDAAESTVRTNITYLRQTLVEYYKHDGISDAISIEVQ